MAKSAEATRVAAAPSFSGLELPAVTVPPSLKTGGSFARRSSDVSRRGPSSASTTVSPPFFPDAGPGTVTGTISSSNRPASWAATAFSWLWRAKRSWRSREMS